MGSRYNPRLKTTTFKEFLIFFLCEIVKMKLILFVLVAVCCFGADSRPKKRLDWASGNVWTRFAEVADSLLTIKASQLRMEKELEHGLNQVRLVGVNATQGIGRVEVRINGRWGTICDDLPTGGNLNTNAVVICRRLGYRSGTGYATYAEAAVEGFPYLMNAVGCTGAESSIFECPRTATHNCYDSSHVQEFHDEDFGVKCTS